MPEAIQPWEIEVVRKLESLGLLNSNENIILVEYSNSHYYQTLYYVSNGIEIYTWSEPNELREILRGLNSGKVYVKHSSNNASLICELDEECIQKIDRWLSSVMYPMLFVPSQR